MKPVAFDYLQARDLHQAAEALARSAGAKIIAGAQSLGPLLNLRLARPELLVDISRVRELQRIEETDTLWRIGAGVTHAQLEDLGARLVGAEVVSEVAAQIAYRSVRNRGTIGGSLAHADPARRLAARTGGSWCSSGAQGAWRIRATGRGGFFYAGGIHNCA